MENIVEIIMRARDEASREMQRVANEAGKAEKKAGETGRSMSGALAFGANVARAALFGLGSAAVLIGAQLVGLERDLQDAASGIAAISGQTADAIPQIKADLNSLFGDNDNTVQDIEAAMRQIYTSFKIFDVKDKKGIAQLLIDWNDVTGQSFEDAGRNFRRLVLTYFGPKADIQKVLPGLADKILAVAQAVGVDPGGLAAALAEGGPVFKTVFGDMDHALTFLAALGGAGGDIDAAGKAVKTFLEQVQSVRDAYKKGEKADDGVKSAFDILGLPIETVQNEAKSVGELLMTSLKNAMRDGKLDPDEVKALGVLFGSRVSEDMALAAGSITKFQKDADLALRNHEGALARAAATTDENVNAKMRAAWNDFLSTIADSKSWEGAQQGLGGLLTLVTSLFTLDWSKAKGGLKDFGEGLFKLLLGSDPAEVSDALVWWWDNTVMPAFGSVVGKLLKGDILGALGKAGDLTLAFLHWGFPNLLPDGAVTFLTKWKDNILATIGDSWARAKTNAADWKQVGQDVWDGFKTSVGDAINGATGVEAWAKNRWADLKGGFDQWTAGMKTIGGQLLDGLMQGIAKKWDDTKKAVQEAGGNVLQWFRDTFRVKSPSREMADIGGYLMEGLSIGIKDAQSATLTEVFSAATAVVDAFKSGAGTEGDQASHKGAAIGQLLMAGVKLALQAAAPEVVQVVTDIGGALVQALSDSEHGWENFGKFLHGKISEWSQGMSTWGQLGMEVFGSFAEFLGGEAQSGFANFGANFKAFLIKMLTGLEAQVIAQEAAGIATAVAQAPATLGASLLAIPVILGEMALTFAAFEGAKALLNSFDVGTPYVDRDQVAQIHQGEIIVPRTFADGLRDGSLSLGGSGNSQPLIVQLWLDGKMVAEQVEDRMFSNLRGLVRADLRAIG